MKLIHGSEVWSVSSGIVRQVSKIYDPLVHQQQFVDAIYQLFGQFRRDQRRFFPTAFVKENDTCQV